MNAPTKTKTEQHKSSAAAVLASLPRRAYKPEEVAVIKRWDEKQQAFHYAFIFALWVAVAVLCAVFMIRSAHWVLPKQACWLSDEQIRGIEGFLFHGTIGALIAGLAKRLISASGPKDSAGE